jgi:glucose/arabinose dehydrogenase
VSIGDLANSANSQNLSALAGRIHRLNDDGSIPADNPFGPGNSTFALGLRNSFGITLDRASGTLFATENSTTNHDEVNRIVAGGNYGWPLVEGTAATPPTVAAGTYMNPIVDYSNGSVVPTGIAVAPDATFGTDAAGGLFVGQYGTGQILRYTLNSTREGVTGETVFADNISGGITDLAFAPDGTLYVSTGTAVLHIVPVQ